MPLVDPTFLGVVWVTAITMRSAAVAASASSGSACSAPASRVTKPP
jgi:hypothetical protein